MYYQNGSWRDWVYCFFDSNRNGANGDWESFSSSHFPLWLTIYNPIPICVTQIHTKSISGQNVGFGTSWDIYGANTNSSMSDYEYITSWSTSSSTMYGAEHHIYLGNHRKFWKYYRIAIKTLENAYMGGAFMDLTATYMKRGELDYAHAVAATVPHYTYIKY